jgi:trehalose/maltose hydrolase-like predicted phosphorylase
MYAMTVRADLDESFEALIFDWDGTAVPDRQADATGLRTRIEALCATGLHLFVVSGTRLGNVDGQLQARPRGPGALHMCCNRGSEVFEVTETGPSLVHRRTASPEEDKALDQAAELTAKALQAHGLDTAVVTGRLNRRKIDLIPVAEWADPKKADFAQLAEAVTARLTNAGISGLAEVVELAEDAARTAGLPSPRITSDMKHVEIGLTDKSDSARFAADWLARRGITGRLVLLAGDELGTVGNVAGSDSLMLISHLANAEVVSVGVEPGGVPARVLHLAGGPARFATLLDAQLARRADHRVPQVDPDPRWVVPLPTEPAKDRIVEALGALANGLAGTRASREEDGPSGSPLFAVAGVYTDEGRLLPGPLWTGLDLSDGSRRRGERRLLDLRTGVLDRRDRGRTPFRSIRFVSVASPHALAFRAEGPAGRLAPGDLLHPPDGVDFVRSTEGEACTARTSDGESNIAVAASDRVVTGDGRRTVERLAAWASGCPGASVGDQARRRLAEIESTGFDALLAEHRHAWATRWADAAVTIEGDGQAAADELSARFAIFHLLSTAAESGEAAVGARGLTGEAYNGHVFWDADVFVLPALAAIQPAAARAMLEYRVRRLRAAATTASAKGLAGARFPWESAADGRDVTPRIVRDSDGGAVPISTGQHEEHIVADIAWAAHRYATWTGDAGFLADRPGRDLVVETARYWASRVRVDKEGRGHLFGVMGPDEYHQVVDDNAYTNVMARWNLRQAAKLLARSASGEDRSDASHWEDLAARLVDGWDPERGVYEQFAGYFDLEPLLLSQVAKPPVAVDVLLGAERVAGSQLIKQADVLMLYHLVPSSVKPRSLGACLDFYEPRTAHGSSLSPAVSASLLARAGRPDDALALFRLAARLDLDDLTGTTAGGLHMATMGGVWQALTYGFLGLEADGTVLGADPRLPEAWSALTVHMRFRGQPIAVRATHDQVTLGCTRPLEIRIGGAAGARTCDPPGGSFSLAAAPSTDRSRP